MPSIQKSFASGMPAWVGRRLPDSRIPGTLRYRPISPAEKPVSATPASRVGTKGASSVPPTAISDQASSRVKRCASNFSKNG